MTTSSNSVADVVRSIAQGLLAVEVARTNPEIVVRTTRGIFQTAESFDPTHYAESILTMFFSDLDQPDNVVEIGQVTGRFPFSDALKVTYPDGYRVYTELVKVISKDSNPSSNHCYRFCPNISINVGKLVRYVQRALAEGFCDDRAELMKLWQRIVCMKRPAVNGRSIVEEMLLNGQLDLSDDNHRIDLGPLAEFRKRVAADPSILLSRTQLSETEALWVSYEWLTMAHAVLDAFEQERGKKLVELREAKMSSKQAPKKKDKSR